MGSRKNPGINWAEHNLVKNGDIVSIAAWQEFDWFKHGYSLRSAGNVDGRFGDALSTRENLSAALGFTQDQWTGMQQVHDANDKMITSKKGVLLAVVVADCVPLLLIDPAKRVVGVAHAGRKGTEVSISKAIVNQMVNYGCKIEDLQAAIGPSIGPCCYESDLWSDNEAQLREIGVKTIIRTDICTKDHNDQFFSHRGDEVEGRFAGLIGLA